MAEPSVTVHVDVLVVGAGLAGLRTATRLAEAGHEVLLVESRASLGVGIRTTGIFVHRTLQDFHFPQHTLGPAIRRVVLYPPSHHRPVDLRSEREEFRVGQMAELCTWAGEEAERHGVQIMLGTAYQGRVGPAYHLQGPHGAVRVRAQLVVGADGARSRVARDLGLDTNRALLVGAEETYPVHDPTDPPPTFHCTLDPRIAPGYLAWVVHDGAHVHVGTAGYPAQFRHGLRHSLEGFRAQAPGLSTVTRTGPVEHRAGPIPVGGLLRRIGNRDGLLVGDAAGAVSPLTAGGLDPCLRLSDHAAQILDEALRTGRRETLDRYDAAPLRRRLGGRMALRAALARTSSPRLVEAAFVVLRTTPGRAAARRILFSDMSFPIDAPSVGPAPALRVPRRPCGSPRAGWRGSGGGV
ncbi:NAD(P)/FAD-dependent oxidoreductase [Ornithinimicrobium pekingense]|uniref:FAD-binding domain-containing protein n=1 Tax=Ornithinimicrobium pekingense TaxID=384677 RepID=A0ABQ2F583_9MICO|nr:NAD(P)/FAD-dependent oxidoreductase [Ornithinimicrobium pekingense]GGK63241.1 hypothetical protein GCM10011509_09510 [Ornithinimicrobium pekingense]